MSDIPDLYRALYHTLKQLLLSASIKFEKGSGTGGMELKVQFGKANPVTAYPSIDGRITYTGRSMTPQEFAAAVRNDPVEVKPSVHVHDPVGERMR